MTLATTQEEEISPLRSLNIRRVGLWLFILSESFLFASLVTARFYLTGFDRPEELNQALGLIITSILLLSSISAYLAEAAIARGERGRFLGYLTLTILLGIVFVGGVAFEWKAAEFGRDDIYGTLFFAMTGLHASHVVSGIVALALVYMLGARGHFSADGYWGAEATIKYWHFVDVVWVVFYPTLYLVS